jgi:hypothetical protein
MEPKKFLMDNEKHSARTHRRWADKYEPNRNPMSPDYKEEWNQQPCFQCQFYVKLTGLLGTSWGICSNESSYLDGKVMYEHDGCEFFSYAKDEESF